MANILKKEKAIHLRKLGTSLNEIAKKIKAPKSSVSYWCRNVVLSSGQINNLENKRKAAGVRGSLLSSEKKRRERLIKTRLNKNLGEKDVGNISKRDLFMVGLALYWGEGYKKGNEEFGFTNSDPNIIKFALKWLRKIYNIPTEKLILRVSVNQLHGDREKEIIEFWSKITNVPEKQFTKTSLIKTKSKKVYLNRHTHFGTLRVKVRRGTNLRRRVLGSIGKLESCVD